jgi:hypothetical protein
MNEPIKAVYILRKAKRIIYVGRANDLVERIRTHSKDKDFDGVEAFWAEDDEIQGIVEMWMICVFKPILNKQIYGLDQVKEAIREWQWKRTPDYQDYLQRLRATDKAERTIYRAWKKGKIDFRKSIELARELWRRIGPRKPTFSTDLYDLRTCDRTSLTIALEKFLAKARQQGASFRIKRSKLKAWLQRTPGRRLETNQNTFELDEVRWRDCIAMSLFLLLNGFP